MPSQTVLGFGAQDDILADVVHVAPISCTGRIFAPSIAGHMKHFDKLIGLYHLGRVHGLRLLKVGQSKRDLYLPILVAGIDLHNFVESPDNRQFLPGAVKTADDLLRFVKQSLLRTGTNPSADEEITEEDKFALDSCFGDLAGCGKTSVSQSII